MLLAMVMGEDSLVMVLWEDSLVMSIREDSPDWRILPLFAEEHLGRHEYEKDGEDLLEDVI